MIRKLRLRGEKEFAYDHKVSWSQLLFSNSSADPSVAVDISVSLPLVSLTWSPPMYPALLDACPPLHPLLFQLLCAPLRREFSYHLSCSSCQSFLLPLLQIHLPKGPSWSWAHQATSSQGPSHPDVVSCRVPCLLPPPSSLWPVWLLCGPQPIHSCCGPASRRCHNRNVFHLCCHFRCSGSPRLLLSGLRVPQSMPSRR